MLSYSFRDANQLYQYLQCPGGCTICHDISFIKQRTGQDKVGKKVLVRFERGQNAGYKEVFEQTPRSNSTFEPPS